MPAIVNGRIVRRRGKGPYIVDGRIVRDKAVSTPATSSLLLINRSIANYGGTRQ